MNINEFITNYTSPDKDKILFKWNGKHAEEFNDDNCIFRSDVIDYILENDIDTPSELLRDLLDEESKFSKEAWGIRNGLSAIGSKLLIQGKTKYVEDFMIAKMRSFDTNCGIVANIPTELTREITDFFLKKLENTDNQKKQFYSNCYEYFLKKI